MDMQGKTVDVAERLAAGEFHCQSWEDELGTAIVKHCPYHPGTVLYRKANGGLGGNELLTDALSGLTICRVCGEALIEGASS